MAVRVQITCTDGDMFARRFEENSLSQCVELTYDWLKHEGIEFEAFGRSRVVKLDDVNGINIEEVK